MNSALLNSDTNNLVSRISHSAKFGQHLVGEIGHIYYVVCDGVSDVRQAEIHTAEPLVPEPSALEVELAIEKLKKSQITRY
jgi:hypothetical protein